MSEVRTKPCPFCRSSRIDLVSTFTGDGMGICFAECQDCTARGPMAEQVLIEDPAIGCYYRGNVRTYAVHHWNKRPRR